MSKPVPNMSSTCLCEPRQVLHNIVSSHCTPIRILMKLLHDELSNTRPGRRSISTRHLEDLWPGAKGLVDTVFQTVPAAPEASKQNNKLRTFNTTPHARSLLQTERVGSQGDLGPWDGTGMVKDDWIKGAVYSTCMVFAPLQRSWGVRWRAWASKPRGFDLGLAFVTLLYISSQGRVPCGSAL